MTKTPLDRAVAKAIEQYREYREQAAPSAKFEPRVIVDWLGTQSLRRPFKWRGYWAVRLSGTAFLLDPYTNDGGDLVFPVQYTLPK